MYSKIIYDLMNQFVHYPVDQSFIYLFIFSAPRRRPVGASGRRPPSATSGIQ